VFEMELALAPKLAVRELLELAQTREVERAWVQGVVVSAAPGDGRLVLRDHSGELAVDARALLEHRAARTSHGGGGGSALPEPGEYVLCVGRLLFDAAAAAAAPAVFLQAHKLRPMREASLSWAAETQALRGWYAELLAG
jgi:hypothetical protein